jgi:Sir2- and TIR-associating SLOG family
LITVRKQEEALLQYWYSDLRRVGIEVVEIDDYTGLDRILLALAKKSMGRTVYFTGSHVEPTSDESTFYKEIGRLIAVQDVKNKTSTVLVDGQSTGRSRLVVSAFLNTLIASQVDVREHIQYFSNPYSTDPALANDKSLLPTLKRWRVPLMKATQLVVAFDGGMGTQAEVELAKEYQCRLLPVPCPEGGTAMKLLSDDGVAARISDCCAEYVDKANSRTLEPGDVAKCIHAMLDS